MSRRGVLVGSAAAVAVMALGACASTDQTGSTSAPSSAPASEPPSESASASASDAEESASPSSEETPTGDPIAGTGDFPVGGGVIVTTAGGPVVVTHPDDNEFLAFNGRCPHMGCPVAEVLENTIMCNCHGSTFDGSTGDRLEGPAPTGLEPVKIQVTGGEIYLA